MKAKNVNVDNELFSGLLTAIVNMYSEVQKSDIQKLEGSEGKFLFFSKNNLIYIVQTRLNEDDKKIKKMIAIIQDLFVKKYEKELINFDGNVKTFSKFESDLNEIFQKISKPEKWGNSLLDL